MSYGRRRLFYFAAGALVLLALFLCALNARPENVVHSTVRISRQSGFYEEAFDLELSSDWGKIYYTLDSSVPDENAILYTGPIHIADASENENVYSMRTDTSVDFYGDLLAQAGIQMRYGYSAPPKPVDKATVVRAVCIDGWGNKSGVVNAVYFVGYDAKPGYTGVNVVSIVTDPANLFDYDTGIYVTGRYFDDALVDGHIEAAADKNIGAIPANYSQKGLEWEREAYLCFFDADWKLSLSGNYGMRIQGGSSRGMLPKGINLFARKKYGAGSFPGLALFGEDVSIGTLNLHPGAQSMQTKLNDYLTNALIDDLNVATRDYEPCEVFLDGEYWGVYWLTPRFDESYFENAFGVYGDDVLQIKVNSVETGSPKDIDMYTSMVGFIADNDMSDPELYAQACELIDIESCIDYYALEIYIANTDWPHHNFALWRTKTPAKGRYSDCRWRWIVYDVNISMSASNAEADFVRWAINRDSLFASLMDSGEFADAVRAKLVQLAQNNFNPDRVDGFISDYEALMALPMANEYARFYGGERSAGSFLNGCEEIRDFFRRRYNYILSTYGGGDE